MIDTRIYVFSLPRCGSSMMCGVLEHLGVKMVYTSETEEARAKTEKNQQKRYGDTYRMNPAFYEITDNHFASWMKIMNTPYSGCKVIMPVGGIRWEAVRYKPAKVIMMKRDVEEIRQSQEASYARARANVAEYNPEEVRAYLRTVIAQTENMLDASELEWMPVDYREAREKPRETVQRIADFIEAPNPIDDAVASIEPDRARFKRELLVEDAI